MALIIGIYRRYFICGRGSHSLLARGKVSYFDPIERTFLTITPSKGEVPAERWIPLPVIKEVDAVKSYLRLMDDSTYLEDYAELDDDEFCVKMAEMGERYKFEDQMYGYVKCYYNERMLKWIEENNIPNCRLEARISIFDMKIENEEDLIKARERI